MAYRKLSDLTAKLEVCSIKVKVMRLWESINTKTEDLMSLDMLLMDEKNNIIHASIWKGLIDTYKLRLKEGSIYSISNFKVQQSSTYRPVDKDLKVIFLYNTNVKEVKEESNKYPKYYFEFASGDVLLERQNQDKQCSYVIGILTSISAIQQRTVMKDSSNSRTKEIRDIELLLLDGKKVKLTLWGKMAYNIRESVIGHHTVVVVTSTMVLSSRFEAIYLKTTSATRIYTDINIRETYELIDRYPNEDIVPKLLTPSKSTEGTLEEQMLYKRRTLQEITEMREDVTEDNDYIFTSKATVDELQPNSRWWYMSCNSCNKMCNKREDKYFCDNCANFPNKVSPRYWLRLQISDGTTTTTCTIFDEEAKRLLQTSISDLLETLDGNTEDVPKIIKQLYGKELIFRFKLNSQNLTEGRQGYLVKRTFVPDDKIERNNMNNDDDNIKVCNEDDVNNEIGKEVIDVPLEDRSNKCYEKLNSEDSNDDFKDTNECGEAIEISSSDNDSIKVKVKKQKRVGKKQKTESNFKNRNSKHRREIESHIIVEKISKGRKKQSKEISKKDRRVSSKFQHQQSQRDKDQKVLQKRKHVGEKRKSGFNLINQNSKRRKEQIGADARKEKIPRGNERQSEKDKKKRSRRDHKKAKHHKELTSEIISEQFEKEEQVELDPRTMKSMGDKRKRGATSKNEDVQKEDEEEQVHLNVNKSDIGKKKRLRRKITQTQAKEDAEVTIEFEDGLPQNEEKEHRRRRKSSIIYSDSDEDFQELKMSENDCYDVLSNNKGCHRRKQESKANFSNKAIKCSKEKLASNIDGHPSQDEKVDLKKNRVKTNNRLKFQNEEVPLDITQNEVEENAELTSKTEENQNEEVQSHTEENQYGKEDNSDATIESAEMSKSSVEKKQLYDSPIQREENVAKFKSTRSRKIPPRYLDYTIG